MNDDGLIDYRNRSDQDLLEACLNIKRDRYPQNLKNLLQELQSRGLIDPKPEADRQAAEQAKRNSWAESFNFLKDSYLTSIFCLFLLGLFSLECLARGSDRDSVHTAIAAAGLIKPLVWHGQWWRLLTGTLVHANFRHVSYNVTTLVLFGGLIEGLMPRPIVALVVLLSALGGSLASLVFLPGTVTVGISGACMGLMGFFGAYQLTRRPALPIQAFAWVGINIGINLAVGALAYHDIDNAAHLGGLLTGVLLGLILTWRNPDPSQSPMPRLVLGSGVLSAVLLFAACIFTALRLLLVS